MGFVLQIVIGTVALGLALFIIGRHEAEMSMPVVTMVAAGITLATILLAALVGIIGLVLAFPIAMWAIHQFCYLGWGKAAGAAALYMIIFVSAQIGLEVLLR